MLRKYEIEIILTRFSLKASFLLEFFGGPDILNEIIEDINLLLNKFALTIHALTT